MINQLKYGGFWKLMCYWPNGSLKWIEYIHNIFTNEALDHALGTLLEEDTQYSNWYITLFDSDSTPAAGWVYSNIGTDFTEFEDYDEATRPIWNKAGVTSQSDTNAASPAEFTCSVGISTTLYGSTLVNVSTKGDNSDGSGIELCASRFGTARPFSATEVIKVVYTLSASSSS